MNATIAYLLVVGVLLAGAARAGEEVLRLAQRPARSAWAGALALLFVLTVGGAVTRPSPAVVPDDLTLPLATQRPDPQTGTGPFAGVLAFVERARNVAGGVPVATATRISQVLPAPLANVFAVMWVAMSVAVLLLHIIVYRRFTRAMRALPTRILHGTRVHVSPSTGPAVVGVLDARIIVPEWLLRATEEEQRLAITHERQHLDALDPQLLIAAGVAAAAIPWHPAAWWMLSRLRLAVEMDCDRRVLGSGMPRRLYASTLIDIATRGSRLPLGAAALADHTTHLERRLIAMAPSTTPYRRTRLLAVGAGMLLTLLAACEARLPSSPEVDAMDAAAVESHALTKVALAGDTTPTHYVDGSRVTAAAARTIAAQDIASIAVNKGVGGSEVRITTKAAAAAASAAAPDAGGDLVPLPKSPGDTVVGALPPRRGELRPLTSRDYAGLIFIDGRLADEQTMARLTPDRVASMEVIKGAAARRLYDDPRAAKGVIRVTTKP